MSQLILTPELPVVRRKPPFFKTSRLAILGNTATVAEAPYRDPRWTLAAHPCCRDKCQREPDWYFDLHGPANFRQQRKSWTSHYYTWLTQLQTPIFMQDQWPDIPMAIKYPRARILAEFRAYFTNHCAWMIALAISEGVTHIGLWGCDYKHEQERGRQRGSVEYWLGVFEGQGGHVILPPSCRLLADPAELYGYESHDEKGKLKMSYRETPTVPAQTKLGPVKMALTVLTDEHAPRPPLMSPPPGVSIAWNRSGHTIHA